MKFGDMTSMVHNMAASLSDGVSFLFGDYHVALHEEAEANPPGQITVDFLTGTASGSPLSRELATVLARGPEILSDLCWKQHGDPSEFAVATARFGTDEVYGRHFLVIVENAKGHRWEERFQGISGRRLRRGHKAAAV